MALVMTAHEALDPVSIRTFRAHTGAFEATCLADKIEEFRLLGYRARAVLFHVNFVYHSRKRADLNISDTLRSSPGE